MATENPGEENRYDTDESVGRDVGLGGTGNLNRPSNEPGLQRLHAELTPASRKVLEVINNDSSTTAQKLDATNHYLLAVPDLTAQVLSRICQLADEVGLTGTQSAILRTQLIRRLQEEERPEQLAIVAEALQQMLDNDQFVASLFLARTLARLGKELPQITNEILAGFARQIAILEQSSPEEQLQLLRECHLFEFLDKVPASLQTEIDGVLQALNDLLPNMEALWASMPTTLEYYMRDTSVAPFLLDQLAEQEGVEVDNFQLTLRSSGIAHMTHFSPELMPDLLAISRQELPGINLEDLIQRFVYSSSGIMATYIEEYATSHSETEVRELASVFFYRYRYEDARQSSRNQVLVDMATRLWQGDDSVENIQTFIEALVDLFAVNGLIFDLNFGRLFFYPLFFPQHIATQISKGMIADLHQRYRDGSLHGPMPTGDLGGTMTGPHPPL